MSKSADQSDAGIVITCTDQWMLVNALIRASVIVKVEMLNGMVEI